MSLGANSETSLFETSLSTVDENTSINNGIEYQLNDGEFDENVIFSRLNALREWQDGQRRMLAENQLDQQNLLELEKQKLYELFGLNASADDTINDDKEDEEDDDSSADTHYMEPKQQQQSHCNAENISPNIHAQRESARNDSNLMLQSPSIDQINKIIKNMVVRSPIVESHNSEANTNVVKRPFLKRGEGLKNRFKISPDAFRLNNLPKYKYADRIRKHAHNASSKQKKRHKNDVINVSPTTTVSTAAATERIDAVEGHQNNVSTANHKSNAFDRRRDVINKFGGAKKNFQSYPGQLKLKPIPNNNFERKLAANGHNNFIQDVSSESFNDIRIKDGFETETLTPAISVVNRYNPLSPSTKFIFDTPIRNTIQTQQNDLNELQHFEQLEKDLIETPIPYNAFNMDKEHRDDSLLLQFKVGLNLSPKTLFEAATANDSCATVREHEQLKSRYSSGSGTSDESKHVRFADDAIKISEHRNQPIYQNIDSSEQSMGITATSTITGIDDTMTNTSSPNEKSTESFRKFKEKLFDRKLKQKFKNQLSVAKDFEISDLNSNKSEDDDGSLLTSIEHTASVPSLNENELTHQNQLVQERLASLEREIQSFREQNTELTKLIREHELIRLTFDQERCLEQERMEQDRVHFEMYMHDERMKMLNEQAEREKRVKDARSLTRTEKDELAKLRSQCANHSAELSTREQKHVAAQARIRAQQRSLEKEFKELRFEVENLRRENKKLETENGRLRRQSNNKILYEINRNISKLNNNHSDDADGSEKAKHGVKTCSNKNAHRTVVAKVTSHREPERTGHLRSKSVPNLHQNESNESYVYDLTSPDGEISDCSSDDTPNKTNAFPTRSTKPKKLLEVKKSNSLDQSDNEQEAKGASSLKRVIENPDGSRDVWYPNGNLKKISADGMCIRMLYFNKDIKETDIKEGIVKYYYAETNTWQTSYLDGLEIFEYPDGQTEHRFKDGTVEIHFPNGSVRITNPTKEQNEGIKEEWKYPDGTHVVQMKNSERLLILPNGQREVHTNGHKRREYPDGTVKMVFPDGSQETRYSNGRVRLKNKDGKLIMDSETISI